MDDPLLWRAGSGELADWLDGVRRKLLGDTVAGYDVWSGPVFPDYGSVIHRAGDTGALARFLTAAGADALRAITHRGARQGETSVELRVEGRTGADALRVVPSGERAGTVRLTAPVADPAALAAWLHQLSPLLPVPVPRREAPAHPLPEALAVTLYHRSGDVLIGLEARDGRPAGSGPRPADGRVLVRTRPDTLAHQSGLLLHPAVLERRPVTTAGELARWLGELDAAWGERPALSALTGRATRAVLPYGDLRAEVRKIEHGTPLLMVGRPFGPELTASGPPERLARWAGPLLGVVVHQRAASSSRRALVRWLRGVEESVFAGAALWTVTASAAPPGVLPGTPVTTAELAALLSGTPDGGVPGVDHLAPGEVSLRGAGAAFGRVDVTGRPAP
ncbi:hypothetical protein PV410_31035 [Streptomyces sp. PA03-5A]|nr:hypothetical protein [Streptomyces sp. PA03-5A]